MRAQLQGLHAEIEARATPGDIAAAVSGVLAATSNNTNGVNTLNQGADPNYNPSQIQDILNKLDELINALRR